MITNQATSHKKYLPGYSAFLFGTIVAALLLTLSQCGPTRDTQTITQLESARDQVSGLYDTFTGTKIDEDRVAAVQSTLAGIRAYEESKGRGNTLMVQQVDQIQSMFERHLAERKSVSRWSGIHKNNKKELIGLAFQKAIASENEKPE
jgi:hypothetical protein